MRRLKVIGILIPGVLLGITLAASPVQKGDANAQWGDARAQISGWLSKDLAPGIEIEVQSVHFEEPLPKDALLLDFSPRPPFGLITIEVTTPNRSRPIYGTAVIKAFAKIAVAKVAIRHGENISNSQIRFERRELTPLGQVGYFLADSGVTSLRARGFVRPGAVLSGANTESPSAVERGQELDLITRKGALVVTARVKALGSGRVNDWIQVENLDSHRILSVRVAGNGEAETR